MLKWKKMVFICALAGLIPYAMTLAWTGLVEGAQNRRMIPSGKTIIMDVHGQKIGRETMNLEDYLTGVTAGQIPSGAGAEAVKAQAILVRTYLYKQMDGKNQAAESALDTEYKSRDEIGQVWGDNWVQAYEQLKSAVDATAGQVILYDGEYIDPLFHQVGACMTRNGTEDHPYLQSVPCPWDVEAENYMQIIIRTPEELAAQLTPYLETIGCADAVSDRLEPGRLAIQKTDAAGYVEEAVFKKDPEGSGEMAALNGEALAEALGLGSSCYTWSDFEGNIRIICVGTGHGYGLCQYGAVRMAEQGKSAEEILKYYYKNIVVTAE